MVWYQEAGQRSIPSLLAALSPSTEIERNHELVDELIRLGDCSHAYGLCIERGRRILAGEPALTVLGGRKTRAFYRNLLDPNRPGPVTIDRHAISLLYGLKLGDTTGLTILNRIGAYQWAAAIYRTVARRYGVLPHQLQAVTWLTWRRLNIHQIPDEDF